MCVDLCRTLGDDLHSRIDAQGFPDSDWIKISNHLYRTGVASFKEGVANHREAIAVIECGTHDRQRRGVQLLLEDRDCLTSSGAIA